jgi:hypothetical protein
LRFVVDETSWQLTGRNPTEILELVENALDLLEAVQDDGHRTFYSDELFHTVISGHRTFWDLSDETYEFRLPMDTTIRASSLFAKMFRCEDEQPQLRSIDVRLDNGPPEIATGISWAHRNNELLNLDAVSCLAIPVTRSPGLKIATVESIDAPVWFVTCKEEIKLAFRFLAERASETDDDLAALSSSAFPDLAFVAGAFAGIKGMSRPYRELRPAIVHHLAILSDHGALIFRQPWQDAPSRFGALGVNLSDENGNTKQNKAAQNERKLTVDGVERYFWWHTKIEPHRDRIHLCPDLVATGGKVTIGIFCRHLTT